ncbi:glycosyltransferase, partial [Mailhella massiliensis]|nr:glycosyltransferase family 2 protein [Mailhella massiliensis]
MNSPLSPLISVIVPICNAARYLPRSLGSILSQSVRNIEVICIYDDS